MVTERTEVPPVGWEGAPMLGAVDEDRTTESGSLIDGIVRVRARRMPAAAGPGS
ncbi:hypothetical protein [Streptomyces sp. NPDC096132]|uniref:hypothetical protein n=1 Tax=Streptomyces sp. NPDC096132 TaxID=3366075 RepID=UPI0038081AF4